MGFGLVALLTLSLLVIVNPFAGDDNEDIPSYRVANAMYIYNAISRQKVALMNYIDMHGDLPGDSALPIMVDGRMIVGNGNQKIETENGEKDKVFPELFQSGVASQGYARIRSRDLELAWMVLKDGEKILGTGHFFKLSGINALEARAYDRKYDDDSSDTGHVLYARNKTEGVDLFIKLDLYR